MSGFLSRNEVRQLLNPKPEAATICIAPELAQSPSQAHLDRMFMAMLPPHVQLATQLLTGLDFAAGPSRQADFVCMDGDTFKRLELRIEDQGSRLATQGRQIEKQARTIEQLQAQLDQERHATARMAELLR